MTWKASLVSNSRLASQLTISAVGLTCKAALNLGFCASVTISGIHHLLNALGDENSRKAGRGIVTVANHISVLDDPLIWGILPLRSYWNLHDMRWALGASDIMFTNPLFNEFFNHGQVFETFRGKGIYQPAVDNAIRKLNSGGWVHLFGEGKINQPNTYPIVDSSEGPRARLPRFKWGTARIVMETAHLPTIIPMWITGFDTLMPEPRLPPRFLPRPGAHLSVNFAPPIQTTKLASILTLAADPLSVVSGPTSTIANESDEARADIQETTAFGPRSETELKRNARCALTDLIQREVEKLGYSVSGYMLGRSSSVTTA